MTLPGDLQDFARRLASFEARSPAANRDALIFAAGQASASPDRSPRRDRLWQASTALITCTSLALAAVILLRPEPEPRIVVVDRPQTRQEQPRQPAAIPDRGQIPSKPVIVDVEQHPDDAQLGEAWKLRQELMTQGNNPDDRLANVQASSGNGSPQGNVEQPLTRASFLGERSQETIHRWLKDQL